MRVVATLSTRTPYHSGLRNTLNTLTSQFDAVYLGLPRVSRKGEEYGSFEHKGVDVVWLDTDLGPVTKIVAGYLREHDPATLIVTVDDDYAYSPDLRLTFEDASAARPDAVLTFSGTVVKYVGGPVKLPWYLAMSGGWHDRPRRLFFDLKSEHALTTIAGYCGCAYPRAQLGEDLIDFVRAHSSSSKLLMRNDDVVLSAYLASRGVLRLCLPPFDAVGETTKPEGSPAIGPSPKQIYDAIHNMKHHFLRDEPRSLLDGLVLVDFGLFMLAAFVLATCVCVLLSSRTTRFKSRAELSIGGTDL
tara:strand:+ start:3393 stop:4298 length:906 start_codon:yes stop_codon:yes gene_type:complete